MPASRVVILGNSGSGKTTLARKLAADNGAAVLSMDAVAWDGGGGSEDGPARKPLAESERLIREFIDAHDAWILEGCYADLAAIALPHCDELIFLNPGVEACLANCRRRPFEPDKFESPVAQEAALAYLLEWVQQYDTRDDEYGLEQHRALFDAFAGPKREVTGPS